MADEKKTSRNVVIEGARILFRNFQGREGLYNKEGERNFCVLLEGDIAGHLEEEGWPVKYLKPRDEEDLPQPYLQVKINLKSRRPPRFVLLTSKGKNKLEEDMLPMLDWIDILESDLIINPYHWDVNGRQGIKPYLSAIYVKMREDYLEKKYIDVPDSSLGALTAEAEEFDDDEIEGWESSLPGVRAGIRD